MALSDRFLKDEQLADVTGGCADCEAVLAEILSGRLGVSGAALSSSTSLYDDLGADSLDISDIMEEIEEAFSIHIPDTEISGLRTFGDLVTIINGLCA